MEPGTAFLALSLILRMLFMLDPAAQSKVHDVTTHDVTTHMCTQVYVYISLV